MAFSVFKENMLLYMGNQNGIESYQDWSRKFANEYDLLIRRGYQTINQVSIQKGNKELLENMVNVACVQALQVREGQHDIINGIGRAIVQYWIGATLNPFPIPVIPAIGSVQNISTTNAGVTFPGEFPNMGFQFPTNDTGMFLDQLINGMRVHLLSIKGYYSTLSIYPTTPPTLAPGYLEWQGYEIPPAGGGRPRETGPDIFTNRPQTQQQTPLTPEQVEAKQQELAVAQQDANNTNSPALGRQTAREYSSLLSSELQNNTLNSTPVGGSSQQAEQLAEASPEELVCTDGLNIVRIAARDIGVIEYGAPDGKNWGGGGPSSASPGRIDQMLSITGLDNQEKVRRTGSGYYWCAAAVAAWWQEAGLAIPSGAASCDNWLNWGRANGRYSTQPRIGAAVLYGTLSDANHIGIVSGVSADGSITTIEGNTSGGAFSRNGVGVFMKRPSGGRIIGYIHPPDCS